jgi:outer membrane protein OmpA-like peptidoglycan-associated protein/tetratricopeptide (TPR) repeat protein
MIKKILFLFAISLLVLATPEISGQSNPLKIKRREFKKQEYGFKDAWISIKEANQYYSMGLGSYRDARQNYLSAYSYNPDNAELNYMIGKCYLYSDNKFESIKYIEKAFKIKPDVQFDIHLMLGMAYHQILEFDKAVDEYNYFLNTLHPKIKADYQSKVDKLIQQCKNGKLLAAEPQRVVINNLGKGVNSVFDEYGPCISKDGKSMYFTSRRKFSKRSEKSIIDNKYFEDAYYSELVNDAWTRARRLDKKVTEKDNTSNIAVVGISPDNQKLYIYKGKEKNGNLYVCSLKKDEWSKPKPLRKFNTKHRETSMCLSSDESTIYFVSSNIKHGYGEGDIYVSHKNINGKWGKPENIGNVVNTFYNELGVSLSANDSVLYFGSEGHNSMGGYDIFKSTLSNVGLWSRPQNLGYPINTPNDDLFYYERPDGKTAYYSANRESGLGGMDIYKIIYLGSEKEMQAADVDDLIVGAKFPYDDIYFIPTTKLNVDTSILMRGFINDSENQKPIIAKIELIDRENSVVAATGISDSTGNYSIKVAQAKNYGVEILAKGYLLYLDVVDLTTRTFNEVVVKNFLLDRVEVGAKVVLKNIYFEFGKATLKTESFIGLDNVVKLMENNETLRIEISGHTDNIGGLKANTKLSTDRAKAVADYLIKKGVNSSRVEYKGYAYNQPVAPNNTENGRAQNRRVEFKVLSK